MRGGFAELYAKGSVYMFERCDGEGKCAAAFNFSGKTCPIPVEIASTVAMGNYPGETAANAPLRPWEFRLIEC